MVLNVFERMVFPLAEQQGNEYEQFTPQTSGRLFSNSMFGFNKEEVLEYLEELADENYQQQQKSEQRIQELTQKIHNLETNALHRPGGEDSEAVRKRFEEIAQELEIARAATQQSEEELQEFKDQLYNMQQENKWLREEYQNSDQQIADLRRQLDEASSGQWSDSVQQINDLRHQIDVVTDNQERIKQQLEETAAERDELRQQLGQALDELDEGADMRQQLEDALNEQEALQQQLDDSIDDQENLRKQLEESLNEQQKLQHRLQELSEYGSPSQQAADIIIDEANQDAARIREQAWADRDRIHRQILSSTRGISTSISALKGDISDVEGDVTGVLEQVQEALASVINSLGRTEQNLDTLSVQVERFPSNSPIVNSGQQFVYFQPTPEPFAPQQPKPAPRSSGPAVRQPAPASYGSGGFKRIWPDNTQPRTNATPFSPQYNSAAATAEAYQYDHRDELDSEDDRMRSLSESLVDTIREIMRSGS